MKSKKKLFKILLPICLVVCVLSCLLLTGSVLATESGLSVDNLNVIYGIQEGEVNNGGEFTATLKITNDDVASFGIAGLQAEIKYDADKVSVKDITSNLDANSAVVVHDNTTDNTVRFVCVKKEGGYTGSELANLFTVTFTAKANITNPATLFDVDDITYMIGKTDADLFEQANKIYGADKQKIAEAIFNSELLLKPIENETVVIATLGTTKGEFDIVDKDGLDINEDTPLGTGSKITVNDEEASIVVKGDMDGDGVITVFDAMIAKKVGAGASGFSGKPVYDYAGDYNDDGSTNSDDASAIIEHIKNN